MAILDTRLIGLSDELAIERRHPISDLHIGWQKESRDQFQADPAGSVHLAPVVRWYSDGRWHRYVPQLSFTEYRVSSRLRRLLGWSERTGYRIDRDALIRRIDAALSESEAASLL